MSYPRAERQTFQVGYETRRVGLAVIWSVGLSLHFSSLLLSSYHCDILFTLLFYASCFHDPQAHTGEASFQQSSFLLKLSFATIIINAQSNTNLDKA